MKKLIALASLALAICVAAPATAQSLTKAQKALEKEQAKITQKAQKEADKIAAKAAKETEKVNKQAAKEAEKAAKKQAENAEKAAKKEAEKAAKKAEDQAKKAAKKAQKEAEKAAKEAEKKAVKEAEKAAKKQADALKKQADKEAKKMAKAADKLNKATDKAVKAEKAARMAVPAILPAATQKSDKTDGTTGATPDAQKKSPIATTKPSLNTTADSVAYLLGIGQSAGLKTYIQQNLNVDTTYMAEFIEGIQMQLNSSEDKAKQAVFAGQQIGQQLQKMAQDVTKDILFETKGEKADPKVLAAGIIEGLTGQNTIPSSDAMTQFNKIAERRRAEKDELENGPNRKAGEEFLAQNKTKEGVVTLPSGLQYKVLTKGKGALPKATDKVKVNYEGHLIDGTEFDSSYKRNTPITFGVNQVIKGWSEALCLMPVGSKWELYIPQELAYGSRKTGNIPPYSTLIFTVELLEIEK